MAKKVEAPARSAAAAKKAPAPAKAAPVSKAKAAAKPAPTAKSATKASKAAVPAKAAPTKAAKGQAAKPRATTAAPKALATKAPSKVVAPQAAGKQPASTRAATSAPAKATPTPRSAAPKKEVPVTTPKKAVAKKAAPVVEARTVAAVRGETKEGIKYTKDFDAKFLTAQHKLLIEARVSLTGQAVRLEDEANSLIDDEMGDVQFDDESGEGDTMVVERERDLFLSARARQDIEEIDAAIVRLRQGTYGYSVISMLPIPRERLEAIPWATELTEEKVGGIGRR